MMKFFLKLVVAFFFFGNSYAQETAVEVLDKAIAHHDPNGHWETFHESFQVTMTTPNSPKRVSDISINLPQEYFSVTATRDTVQTRYTLDKGTCDTNVPEAQQKGTRTPCETAELYKNYYTYLYGLPMKLKDPGTNLSPALEKVAFKGKKYLRIKATYDEAVGSDVWFFYFDPTTYAMEIYQFFKGDPKGEGKDTGEYILLSEESTVNGINMPRVRAWYYNKDDKYLGTDAITK